MIAHVAFGGLLQRLVIPRVIATLPQRLVDDPAAGLTGADIGVISGKVPTGFGLGAQGLQGSGMGRILRQIAQLLGVGLQIEQLIGVQRAAVVFPLAIAHRHQRRI